MERLLSTGHRGAHRPQPLRDHVRRGAAPDGFESAENRRDVLADRFLITRQFLGDVASFMPDAGLTCLDLRDDLLDRHRHLLVPVEQRFGGFHPAHFSAPPSS
ncbi:hypothetical protein [Amycolatopsis sp. M39]|uniref:hypothetical protein n=1 Tax=Amycolatopsis TaxID=1813 RepID=UPI00350FB2E2